VNCDVHRCNPQCPVNVVSRHSIDKYDGLQRANSGHSAGWRTGKSTRGGHLSNARKLLGKAQASFGWASVCSEKSLHDHVNISTRIITRISLDMAFEIQLYVAGA
jgi:hypothetical protein